MCTHPTEAGAANTDQAEYWNSPSGQRWITYQEALDRRLAPVTELLLERADVRGGECVIDVGCGTGATTLRLAAAVGAHGSVLAVDISESLLAAARRRCLEGGHANVRLIRADAQTHRFERACHDLVTSRFGVMFFDDPVAAFANLRRSANDDALLQFIAWRGPADNPFMTTAERAAASLLPKLPPRRPNAPGQFAFASDDRVRAILQESGWSDVDVRPIDVDCTLPERELVRYFTRLGPVGVALQDADESTRAAVIEAVRPAFDPFVQGDRVRFTAACWMVRARSV
jgi:SAM-dependent methyltransferase